MLPPDFENLVSRKQHTNERVFGGMLPAVAYVCWAQTGERGDLHPSVVLQGRDDLRTAYPDSAAVIALRSLRALGQPNAWAE